MGIELEDADGATSCRVVCTEPFLSGRRSGGVAIALCAPYAWSASVSWTARINVAASAGPIAPKSSSPRQIARAVPPPSPHCRRRPERAPWASFGTTRRRVPTSTTSNPLVRGGAGRMQCRGEISPFCQPPGTYLPPCKA